MTRGWRRKGAGYVVLLLLATALSAHVAHPYRASAELDVKNDVRPATVATRPVGKEVALATRGPLRRLIDDVGSDSVILAELHREARAQAVAQDAAAKIYSDTSRPRYLWPSPNGPPSPTPTAA